MGIKLERRKIPRVFVSESLKIGLPLNLSIQKSLILRDDLLKLGFNTTIIKKVRRKKTNVFEIEI